MLERAKLERESRRTARSTRLFRYQTDPVGFVENELFGFLWSKQKEICRSVVANRRTMVKSAHDTGKALGAHEPVLTPSGWRSIGTLALGDKVIAGDGSVTCITGVFPQGERQLFNVTLDDGSGVLVDAEHLWLTTTRNDRRFKRGASVRTTAQIAETLTFKNGRRLGLNHMIPTSGVVEHPDRELPIEPYLFGQWLGDGDTSGRICGAPDQLDELTRIGVSMTRRRQSPGAMVAHIHGLKPALREIGFLGLRSYEKKIPEIYLRSSPAQRLALLQGLMDTDGTIGRQHEVCFDTTAAGLAEGVADLVRSFGGVVRRSGRIPKFNGVEHRYCHRLWLSLPCGFMPFRLARKIERLRARATGNGKRHLRRFIAKVEPAHIDQAVCIRVAHPSQTFLTRHHIVTHNSALAARIGAWWLSVHPPGDAFLVTTAPTDQQVKAILWREIGKVHAAGGLPGRLNQAEWYIGNELVGFGRKPSDTDPGAFQGIHARYVLVIVDEACGVAGPLWPAIDSLLANDDSRLLCIGNPDDPVSEFATACRPGSGAHVIRINALESPNFSGEPIPDWLSRLLVGKAWVEEKKRSWGETSPLYIAKVLGEFPDQSTDGLVPISALRAACDRTLEPDPSINELGVDVARFGSDATVIYHRLGGVVRRFDRANNRDLMHVVGMIVRALRETKATKVKIDEAGLGGGVVDRLNEIIRDDPQLERVDAIGVNVGEAAALDEDERQFKGLRAELNWKARELLINGEIDLDPEDDRLLSQAAQMKYTFTSKGQVFIEPKKDMKSRLMKAGLTAPSPDDWDAFVLCVTQPGGFDLDQWLKAWGPPA